MARRYFLGSQRIELQKLARDLGISRATAYRWAGSAEQLVGEVLASIVDETFRNLMRRTADLSGSDRVLKVLQQGMHYSYNFSALRQFLRRNPEQGLKVVASSEGPVQPTTVNNIEKLLTDEIQAGNLVLPVQPGVMAYALTRLIESFLYADVISGTEQDLDNAAKILELMLRQG